MTNIRLTYDPFKLVSIAPLIVFRIIFGVLMLFSLIRFWANGWIEEFYLEPVFHFTFYGFDWVTVPSPTVLYLLFGALIVSALFIIVGLYHRTSAIFFFLAFTYVELMDKTYYLNHYYFISLVSFLLIWLPASASFSLDTFWRKTSKLSFVPAWNIDILKFQVGIVYFFAGVAKINSDWLLDAQPMTIWLEAFNWWPVIGGVMAHDLTAYVFSWAGMLFDISIVFFLLNANTRIFAWVAVWIFHILTGMMFPIGVFPVVMISLTLIFFSNDFHQSLLKKVGVSLQSAKETISVKFERGVILKAMLGSYLIFQLIFPFRYLIYPGSLFWTEQGYRFGWRVMLMEKAGMATFFYKDNNGMPIAIDNKTYLTPLQERMMATQPDMILQFAHFLNNEIQRQTGYDVTVHVDAYVSLQGQRSRPFIDSSVDLSAYKRGFEHKNWILPYEN